mmetsp:Transcript_13544/g.27452  ORF Transcript_13544/g.27452 Transcript_13544/m.27452 type:complete len:817 (+) Transcript_13544:533-2983(+)
MSPCRGRHEGVGPFLVFGVDVRFGEGGGRGEEEGEDGDVSFGGGGEEGRDSLVGGGVDPGGVGVGIRGVRFEEGPDDFDHAAVRRLKEGGDGVIVLVVDIGPVSDQEQGELLVFDDDAVHEQIVRFSLLVDVGRVGIGSGLHQRRGHLAVISLDRQRERRAVFFVLFGDVGARLDEDVDAFEMSLLGRDVDGRDAVDVGVLVGIHRSVFDHFGEFFEVVRSGRGDGVDVGSAFDHEFGAFGMSSRRGEHDGGAPRVGGEVDVLDELFGREFGGEGVQQGDGAFVVSLGGDGVEGRDSVEVDEVRRGSALQQEFHGLAGPSRGGLEEGAAAVGVQFVDVHVAQFEEEFHGLDVSRGGGVHERRDVRVVHGVGVGLRVRQEVANGVDVSVGRGDDEGGESRVRHPVDVFGIRIRIRIGIRIGIRTRLSGRPRLHQRLQHPHRPVLRRVHQRGDPLGVPKGGVGSVLQEQSRRRLVSPHAGRHERRDVIAPRVVGIGIPLQQRLQHVRASLPAGQPQRRDARIGRGVHLGSLFQEQLHHLDVAHDGRLHQGRDAVLVPGVDVGSLFQQQLGHVQVSRARRRNERGQIVPIPRVDVHFLLLEQFLHELLVPVGRRPDETRARGGHGLDVGGAGELELEGGVGMGGGVARGQAGLGSRRGGRGRRGLVAHQAELRSRGGFRQHVAGGGIAVDVPRFGAAVGAFGQFHVLGRGRGGRRRGSVGLVAFGFAEARAVGVGLAFVDGPFVDLVAARGADHVEQRVDGAPFEVFAVEAQRVGGILQEERGRALGFGHGRGGRRRRRRRSRRRGFGVGGGDTRQAHG